MSGKLTCFVGPMFSGKSEELLRKLRRARIAELGVQVFVPSRDDRHGVGNIVSHSSLNLEDFVGTTATALDNAHELFKRVRHNTSVVGIDEVQFFGPEIVPNVLQLVESGRRVYVAGLDLDFQGNPFGAVPHLLAVADEVVKCKAVCVVCKKNAGRTYRTVDSKDRVLIGAGEAYQARCTDCYLGKKTTP